MIDIQEALAELEALEAARPKVQPAQMPPRTTAPPQPRPFARPDLPRPPASPDANRR